MTDLADGETIEVQGSGKKPYVLKNTGGVYSCTCPAWRNQSLAIEQRTCKHLRKLRGEEVEAARIGTLPERAKTPSAKPDKPSLLLAHRWENEGELAGWWMSEKLDGVRAYWNGTQFFSRLGNRFLAPDYFTAGLPDIPLDGELWVGRGQFQKTVSIVRRQDAGQQWQDVRFLVFDAPRHGGRFEERWTFLQGLLEKPPPYASLHGHQRCDGVAHMKAELERIEELGGEGLMLRQPGSFYEEGRSATLLKVKSFFDAEAKVIGHTAGRGRHKGRLGALDVITPQGVRFAVGTGLSDAEREDPPAVGCIVTYRYQELTDTGVPRFPSFIAVRTDYEWPAEAVAAEKVGETPQAAEEPAASGEARCREAHRRENEERLCPGRRQIMTGRKVRWGVLSTAKIGTAKVIPAIRSARGCAMAAIASRNLRRARAAAESLEVPRAYGSYEELLADPEIDAVYNPLPNHLHVPWSIRALEAGKHVLCEKPIGLSSKEGQELVDAALRFPRLKVMEAFMYRHHPQWRRARQLISEGEIGELRTIRSFFSYFNDDPENIRNIAAIGGGGLWDIGCYCVSLSRFLFGAEPQRVCGIVELDPRFLTDRLSSGMLDFGRGTATFTCGTQLESFQHVDVFGTAGRLEIEIPFTAPPGRACRLLLARGGERREIVLEPCDQYATQAELFARAVLDDAEVPTPIEDAVANMRVLEALVRSGERGGWESPQRPGERRR